MLIHHICTTTKTQGISILKITGGSCSPALTSQSFMAYVYLLMSILLFIDLYVCPYAAYAKKCKALCRAGNKGRDLSHGRRMEITSNAIKIARKESIYQALMYDGCMVTIVVRQRKCGHAECTCLTEKPKPLSYTDDQGFIGLP